MFDDDKAISDDELAHWLAFSMVNGVGPRRVAILLERLESMKTAWNASRLVLQRLEGIGEETINNIERARAELDPQAILGEFKESGMQALTWLDPRYPYRLRHIADPPVVLYVNGEIGVEDLAHTVGIVGTRRPSSYGEKIAKEVARGLSSHGVTVVSGMAVGIDSLAHWGALEGSAPTIAVLGCGADICYPSSNRKLFNTILKEKRGAIVSEYYPGTKPESFRFPARNRIISGLSEALVVVEGGIDSGSLITARQAFDQCRDVFAFPGRVDSAASEGPNHLIREHIAQLCTSYEDILLAKNWVQSRSGAEREKPAVVQLYGREKELFELISIEPVHFDTLSERSGMPTGELSATLTMLELAGLIHRAAGDWYSRMSDIRLRN
ncbi:MAG: DNA-processing protein DprA [Candidatus Obscuribacterales bacterium]|nr:DNA-processing protein DprA [Candidatus Obscuribacterales bacterium]